MVEDSDLSTFVDRLESIIDVGLLVIEFIISVMTMMFF